MGTEQFVGWRYIGRSSVAHYCVSAGRNHVMSRCGMLSLKDKLIPGTAGVTARRCKRCEK